MSRAQFDLQAPFQPAGDQPKAIAELMQGLERNDRFQSLLGVTGSGKTMTMANVIAQYGKPTLVMSHNKTLAAQLYGEIKSFFPQNAVEYFISYYDYYQPEAYVPTTDTYIEKDASINEDIDRLRLRATSSPHSSTRTPCSSYAGKISTVSPRTRKVPRSNATSLRLYWMPTSWRRMSSRAMRCPRVSVTIVSRYVTGSPRP